MSQLTDKIVLVTGASSGIGRSTAKLCAREGARLVLAARRIERLEQLAHELAEECETQSHCLELDVRDRVAVESSFANLPLAWIGIDILVNNAGLSRGLSGIHDGDPDDWEEMIDTNVKGLLYVTRAVLPGMLERDRGHVINIGSIAGREVYPGGGVYCASKYAVRAITQGIRADIHGTPIRVSTVDPGLVETEFSLVRFHGDSNRASQVYQGARPLTPDDVADAVVFCATRPHHATVAELVLLATDQSSATRVHRRPKKD